jgi:hypothetical protein
MPPSLLLPMSELFPDIRAFVKIIKVFKEDDKIDTSRTRLDDFQGRIRVQSIGFGDKPQDTL